MPDIRRAFQYNAAFEMALWAANDEGVPTAATIKRHPSWHYQSSLVAFVFVAAALAFLPALILASFPSIPGDGMAQHGVVLALRLLLLPIVVMFVDEGLRALARRGHRGIAPALFAPVALFDGLVARAPTDDELAVAATALRELRRMHDEESA